MLFNTQSNGNEKYIKKKIKINLDYSTEEDVIQRKWHLCHTKKI